MKETKHEVLEYHRGKWIPIMNTDKDGKEKKKIVMITEDQAEVMSQAAIEEVKERKRTNAFKYVAVAPDAPAPPAEKKVEDMSAKDLKVILTEKGIEFKGNASKDTLLELVKAAE